MAAVALDSSQVGTIGIGVIVALVVIGLLLGMIVTALIGRLLIVLVVVVLGVVVWQQRTTIENRVKKCELSMTFMGVHVHAPKDVQQQCEKRSSTG